MFKELIIPAGLLSALIIGAGMFSLPYLFSLSGVLVGFYYLAIFSIYFSIVHLMYAEIINSTPGDHRFVGYAKIYLGRHGYYLSFITTVIGLIAALLIYISLSASFIQIFLPNLWTSSAALLFWLVSTIPVILGIRKIADASFGIAIMMVGAILFLFLYGVSGFAVSSLKEINISNIFLPYAAVLFSLGGRSAISSIKNYLQEGGLSLKYFNLSILLGTIIPAILYCLFVVGIIGLSGGNVAEDAISGLVGLPKIIILAAALLGIMALWTSYIFLGLEFKEILKRDFKLKGILAAAAVTVFPIALYFCGLDNFLQLIGIAGGVFLALESIIVILMWQKLKKRKLILNIFSWLIILIFLLGAFYEFNKLF